MSLALDLSGRKAFVSGVTSGIGAGIARQLARAGCDVAGCGRRGADSEGARDFVASVEAEGRRALYLSGDVSRPEEPARLVAEAVKGLGGVDILVSNAGRNVFEGVASCTDAAWEECMNLDLAAHWRLAKAARPCLETCGSGVVILIGSNHAWSSIPGCFPYNVAKAGMLGLVQSLAIEWGPAVRTVGIAPGFIDTAGNQTWFDSFEEPAAERARTEAMHPVKRLGTAEEVGAFCVFLASEHAAFMTGCTYLMDGGRSALMQDGGGA